MLRIQQGTTRRCLIWILAGLLVSSDAFAPLPPARSKVLSPSSWILRRRTPPVLVEPMRQRSTRLYFFFGKKDEKDSDKKPKGKNEEEKDSDDGASTAQVADTSFFGNLFGGARRDEAVKEAETEMEASDMATAVAVTEKPEPAAGDETPTSAPLTPQKQAEALRAQAERARLEAERMDAELTLEKIDRLEKELVRAKKKGQPVDELQREMDALLGKMRGEPPAPKTEASPKKTEASPKMASTGAADPVVAVPIRKLPKDIALITSNEPTPQQPVNQEKFQEYLKEFEEAPEFSKVLLAGAVGMIPDDPKDINSTEVALRMEMQDRMDYSFVNVSTPEFTAEEIKKVKSQPFFGVRRKLFQGNMTDDEAARKILTDTFYSNLLSEQMGQEFAERVLDDESDFLRGVAEALNRTELDTITESLFPPCTRKEDQSPTQAQVMTLISEVLPKASFMASGKPEPVSGGFLVRGTSKLDSGDATIDAIDAALAKSSIRDKLSVFYIKDLSIFTEEQMDSAFFDPTDVPPVLLVLGPDVTREPRRVLFSSITALGIASSWYLSIYPFLLNSDIMKRAEEQMNLADANMQYDLSWLTDMSMPLFLSFMAIQLLHEVGHRVAAGFQKVELTIPTLVPSLITGITSSVTTFKSPPKNKEAMFDVAIAGPLTGIVASLAALFLGLQLTVNSDPQSLAMLPALPLEILRQSTLGGGVIEFVLGAGALGVPGAALGSSAVASINISLHPIAIAGYIGLIINALSLLPIGTTDGGRISQTLFGRGPKIVVGQIFLFLLLVVGLIGSDLFLFYFSFLIFFQKGNEIPTRNEVDDVSFSRVLLATFAEVVALLSLIPFS